jgi:hypothetical protein
MIDTVGTQLADLDEVREEARRRAHILLSDGYRKGEDRANWMIDVYNENGAVVLSISLKDATAN